MKIRSLLYVVLVLPALASAGCVDSELVSPPEISAAVAQDDGASSLAVALRALGMGLSDPKVRSDLRDAMRASLLTEHKLIFQEYLATPAGNRWVAKAADLTATTPGSIRSAIARLPEMDLYLPYREHRLTWRATADVALAIMMDVDAKAFHTYGPDGSTTMVAVSDTAPSEAILMIHPAEVKGRRIRPQAPVPGDVVQDPGDGEVSGRLIWSDHQTGESVTLELADLVAMNATATPLMATLSEHCDPETAIIPCDEDPGSAPQPDTTYLTYFKVYFSDGPGSAEIEYRATHYNSSNQATKSMTFRMENVTENTSYYVYSPLMANIPGTGERIRVKLYETDLGPDDFKGEANIYSGDRNVTLKTMREEHESCVWIDLNSNGIKEPWLGEEICDVVPTEETSEFKVTWPL